MEDIAAVVLAAIQATQIALQVLYGLALSDWRFPPACTPTNFASPDFIIIGGGSAGSVLANRLSANSSYNVMLIEAGGYPPMETEIPGLFPIIPSSIFDYNMTSVNDFRTAQNLQGGVVGLTAGKMLGGTGSLDHLYHVHGNPQDYNEWAALLDDDAWNYNNFHQYLQKQEKLTDPELLKINHAGLHGTDGYVKIRRQTHSANDGLFEAARELGYKVIDNITPSDSTVGIADPLFNIDDQLRQSSALTYLSAAKNRPNLCVVLHTIATKILIKDGVAIGVQVVNSDGDVSLLYANKEVIVSAGTLNSPKVLMMSGIGPQEHLESLDIEVVADLPVGENLQDHQVAVQVYQMEADTATTAASNPYEFPVPSTCVYGALDSKQLSPDYQAITLTFPHDSTALVQLCSNVFKYSDEFCNKWYAASAGRTTLFVIIDLLRPKSHGSLRLATANYEDNPEVYTNYFTDEKGEDLALMAKSLTDFNRFTTTKYFKSVNAQFVDLDVCSNASDFWECYALALSSSLWHYSSTCSMGTVLDSKLRVKGIERLRVIDGSSMPTQVSGNPRATIQAIAEFGATLIIMVSLNYYFCESATSAQISENRFSFEEGKPMDKYDVTTSKILLFNGNIAQNLCVINSFNLNITN